MKSSSIPLIPKETIRVNVAVDKHAYTRAKELGIDIHTLFRMTLQQALEILEERADPPTLADFLSSELEPSRVLRATQTAVGPYPWPDKRA